MMTARPLIIAAVGLVCAALAVAAGIYLAINIEAPRGFDVPLTLRLLNGLPLLIIGLLLTGASTASVPRFRREFAFPVLASGAVLALLALYVAVDFARDAGGAGDRLLAAVAVLTTFAPVTAIALACFIASNELEPGPRFVSAARVGGLGAIVLSAAYVLWFHENRSLDTSGNWWFFLSLFAWGAGWGLALVAAVSRPREPLQRATQLGALALVLFALAFAWEVDGGRDEPLFFGQVSSRLVSLGLIVLVLSGVRLGIVGIAVGIGLMAIALQQGLDAADLAVPGFQEAETVFLNRAGVPMAMGALLALLSAVWARENSPAIRRKPRR